MFYSIVSKDIYILRLVKGEKVLSSLRNFAELKKIKNATLLGIGSVSNPTLSYYKLNTKKYLKKEMIGDFELISFIGSIMLLENDLLVHAHISISDETMQTYAGHLVEAETHATVEIVLTKLNSKITKKFDKTIGLNLLDLHHKL